MKRLWYLSGGMEKFGKENFNESNDWRVRVGNKIHEINSNIEIFNPNSHWSYLSNPKNCTEREIMNLDIYKLRNSELVIYKNNDPFSRGSMIELGIAWERRIPIITLNTNDNECHSWVSNMSEIIFTEEEIMIDYLAEHYMRIN